MRFFPLPCQYLSPSSPSHPPWLASGEGRQLHPDFLSKFFGCSVFASLGTCHPPFPPRAVSPDLLSECLYSFLPGQYRLFRRNPIGSFTPSPRLSLGPPFSFRWYQSVSNLCLLNVSRIFFFPAPLLPLHSAFEISLPFISTVQRRLLCSSFYVFPAFFFFFRKNGRSSQVLQRR